VKQAILTIEFWTGVGVVGWTHVQGIAYGVRKVLAWLTPLADLL